MTISIHRGNKAQFNKPTANSFFLLKFQQSTPAVLERMKQKKMQRKLEKTQSILAANDIVLSEHRFHPVPKKGK